MALALSLSFSTVALAGLVFVVGHFLWQIIYYRFFHPLASFPGPFWGSVTRLWITYQNVLGREAEACQLEHDKYGPVIRITPTMLLVSDASKLPIIYHRTADKTQHFLTGATGEHESIFNMQGHKVHSRFRKVAATPYNFSNVKRMEPLIDAQINHWLKRLDELYSSTGKPFDFCPWAVYMAYDVVSELGFGAPFGFIEQGRDVAGLIKGMHDGLLPFGIMARMHPIATWLMSTRLGKKYLVARPDDDNGFGAMMRFRDALVAKRFDEMNRGVVLGADGTPGRVDILQNFLEARDEKGEPLSLNYIKAEVLLVLIGGAATTGTAIQAFVKTVLSRPDIYTKLMAEINAADQEGKLSSPIPQWDEVQQHCPYYVACVHEALRLFPPAPSIFPRLVSKGGLQLYENMFVPEGTEITAAAPLVQRDQAIFGADADTFRPERWMEGEDRVREFNKASMTFGYGSRSCLGQHVARMELHKAPLQLFRTFDVAVRDEGKTGQYSVRGGVAFFQDMWITLKKRK